MSETLFVLGTALDPATLHDHCVEAGLDASAIRPLGRAYLPDHAPAFVDRGRGGTLVATERRGSVLAGVLFEVRDGGALFSDFDRSRGHAVGKLVRRTVLAENGRALRVLFPEHRFIAAGESFAAPSAADLDALLRGLQRFGHEASPFRGAALGRKVVTEPSSLFVYGTLRRGEPLAEAIETHDPFESGKGVISGSVPGRLYNLGTYPGFQTTNDVTVRVRGEVYTFADLDPVFASLDSIEDFHGYDEPGGEFMRVLVLVDLDARERLAWTYAYAGDVTGRPLIASGDWLLRGSTRVAHGF